MKKITLILIALQGIMAIASAQNRALDFDGVDDNVYCNTPFNPALSTEGTIEFWVNLDAIPTTNARLTSSGGNSTAGDEIYIIANNGRVATTGSFVVGDNLSSTSALPTGTWTHVAITANTIGSILYINGVQDNNGGAAAFNINNFRFGGQYTGSSFESINGKMDEVRVWNDVRTEQEINDNMYSELSNPTGEANLVAYFQLNETSGTTASDIATNYGTNNGSLDHYGGLTFADASVSVGGVFPIYVDGTVTGGDGATWATAYSSLQDALTIAVSGNVIWVAEGTYYPSVDYNGNPNGRYNAFEMINGVEIYGGFDHTGTQTATSQRTDYGEGGTNETKLSGYVDGTNDCYHVFNHPGGTALDNTALLDGFTITAGNANSNGTSPDPYSFGGGMYNDASSPTINNCVFLSNTASASVWTGGGAMYNESSSPIINSCVFKSNSVSGIAGYGGAIYNKSNSSPIIKNSLFTNNSSKEAGAIYNTFSSGVVITNCTFTSNSAADKGGAVYNDNSNIQIINSILWGNTANTENEIYNNNSTPIISNSNIEGNGASGTNIDSNPLFAASLNTSHPYSLTGASPCADVGDNSTAVNNETYDIRGADFGRKLLKTDANTAGTIDMGAYEYKDGTDFKTRLYVDLNATGTGNNGSSWTNAFKTTTTAFQDALNAASAGYAIWVADGTYYPSTPVGGTGDRYNTFQMKNGVEIYGGFAGNETSVADRQIGSNVTILSGDIGTVGTNADNCYHVFYHPSGTGLDNTAILDGFTITGGNANGSITHAIGGGIYNDNSSPKVVNCIFKDNYASQKGGAIHSTTTSSLDIINSVFINNSSTNGGAIYNTNSSLSITNCTFANNNANSYGGAFQLAGNGYTLTAKNCVFWGNTAANGTNKQIYIYGAANYYNCDIEGSGGSSNWVSTELGTNGGGNIDSDPLFADVGNGDYSITSLSPCADVGSDASNSETYDIRGSDYGRKLLKTNYLTTGTIDMGAYEFNSNTDPTYNTPTWTGALGTDFTEAGNWDGGVPTANTNVRIPDVTTNDPVIGAAQTADCNNLTVESGASLTLQSIADGSTGSLIINGTLSNSGTITSQRYFPGATLLNWHMVSAPVSGMGIAASGFAPTTGDFYAWDEPTPGTWSNYKNTTVVPIFNTINGGDNFVPAKGYLLAFNEANPTYNFVGNLNVGDQTFQLKNSAGKDYSYSNGWNLIGNPYSSAIDWNNATRTQFQDNFAYAYDPAAGAGAGGFINIDGTNPDAYIAANQAFFVHATTDANNGTFTFTNAMQAHGGTYYKNKAEDDKLVLRFSNEQYYDEATIRQREASTFNKDRVDAYKMNSFNVNAPNIYSISNDNANLSVNSIPYIDAENNIRIGIVAPKVGLYTISVTEASNYMMDHNVYLEDLLLNTLHKISESNYIFTSDKGDIADRFILHFGVLGVDEPTTQPELIQIWAANNVINIHNANNYIGDIKVLNTFGQLVVNIKLTGDANQQIAVTSQSGIYIVNITTNKGVVNKKVYLR